MDRIAERVLNLCIQTDYGSCLTDVLKKRSMRKNWFAYGIACGFVLLYGYNRIHMTNHFLSDVCFGTLITYLIFAAVSCAFLRTADHANGSD